MKDQQRWALLPRLKSTAFPGANNGAREPNVWFEAHAKGGEQFGHGRCFVFREMVGIDGGPPTDEVCSIDDHFLRRR